MIHPTAIVDKRCEIDPAAEVGAYAVIEPHVKIGAGTRIWPHAYISSGTTIGERCQIHPFAVVGHDPQDLKFTDQPSYTVVGDETVVREHATIHRGTEPGSSTIVGRRCFIMSTGHIGHNCQVGDDVKLANSALLSGHCQVGSGAFISGNASVHQFVRIGELTMIGGGAGVGRDVPPFLLVYYHYGVTGVNVVGLRRAGLSSEEVDELRECYRLLYRARLGFRNATEKVVARVRTPAGRRLAEFLTTPSRRGFERLRVDHSVEAPLDDDL
jgi:UDP-N-acetylglucosamine acyltransferase